MRTPYALVLASALKSWLPRAAIAAVAWAWSAIPCLAADAAPAAAPAAGEPLRSIAEILALSPAEIDAQPEAVVRGVVTSARPPGLVIQEGDSPIFVAGFGSVEADDGSAPTIERGMIVEIEGSLVAAGYAPGIIGRRTRVVGRGPVPPPVPADLGRLARGGDEGRWVTVQGVVQGFGERTHWQGTIPMLMLEADGWPLRVSWLAFDRPFDPARFVDAEVRVTGLVSALRNSRGQFVAPSVVVTEPDEIEILAPPPADPFTGEVTPLDALGRFVVQQRTGHRVRTEGIVSYAAPGRLFLQDPSAAVRVDLAPVATAAEPRFIPGDRVQVAGFLDMSRSIAGLTFAVVRRVGSASPPEPESLTVAEIARVAREFSGNKWVTEPGSYDGRLVRCTGVVEAVETGPAGLTATLTSPDGRWFATLDAEPESPARARFNVGSTVAVAGILRLDLDGARINGLIVDHPMLERITVLARDAADIEVVQAASWWTPRRLAAVLAAATAGLVASVGGVVLLGRRVRRQAIDLAASMQHRQQSAVEFEATLRERNRLAANLHDTVLQTVTGIGYQLTACRADDGTLAADAPRHLDVVDRMVGHAVHQLRGTVWALQATAPTDRTLPEAVRELAARLAREHDAVIEADVAADLPALPDFVAGNLLLVAQEALLNAARHAAAAATTVRLHVPPPGDAVVLEVADDGRGFDPRARPRGAQGHFGVDGMRERVERIGGTLDIRSSPGRGTTVTVRLPLG
ncbi:MAG: sensor histidine kinase [Planctomycetia bacterium]|jgi:signal transduction histidine kinase